jgi:hypothetical protein
MIWYPPVGSEALRNLRELIVQYFSATLPVKLVANLRMDGCSRKATCVPWRRGVRDYFAADSLDFCSEDLAVSGGDKSGGPSLSPILHLRSAWLS